MLDRRLSESYSFDASDSAIHEFAVAILLGEQELEGILTQGNYAYQVKGGKGGHLYYRKGHTRNWVLVANWCFYGLYIVIRYRKPIWLRPMYHALFSKMNFVSVTFGEHSIELVSKDGQILHSRRFRLSPPSAFDEVMAEKFGYSQERIESLRVKAGFAQ